jgi:hypothetical protein
LLGDEVVDRSSASVLTSAIEPVRSMTMVMWVMHACAPCLHVWIPGYRPGGHARMCILYSMTTTYTFTPDHYTSRAGQGPLTASRSSRSVPTTPTGHTPASFVVNCTSATPEANDEPLLQHRGRADHDVGVGVPC